MGAAHEDESVVGSGCDDQFEFALDLLLAGYERLHQQVGRPPAKRQARTAHDLRRGITQLTTWILAILESSDHTFQYGK